MEIKMSALQIHTVTVSPKLIIIINTYSLVPWGIVNFVSLKSKINVPLDLVLGNIKVQGKQNSLFPKGPVIM